MSDAELDEAIETIVLAGGPDANDVADRAKVLCVVAETRQRGFALASGEAAENISAIALPVISKGRVAGAINVVFFRKSFSVENAIRYLEPLRRCVKKVEAAFDAVVSSSQPILDSSKGLHDGPGD